MGHDTSKGEMPLFFKDRRFSLASFDIGNSHLPVSTYPFPFPRQKLKKPTGSSTSSSNKKTNTHGNPHETLLTREASQRGASLQTPLLDQERPQATTPPTHLPDLTTYHLRHISLPEPSRGKRKQVGVSRQAVSPRNPRRRTYPGPDNFLFCFRPAVLQAIRNGKR